MVHTEIAPGKIAGGFVLVEVAWLMSAWRACRSAPLGIGDFRALLACREMVARRCRAGEDRAPSYGFDELARLLGVTRKRASASVRRLEVAGLIAWSEAAIGFPDLLKENLEQVQDSIGRGRGSVAIPRRMLRFLASGARPALIATVLGILLRCLSRRKGGFRGRGRVKAAWIATTFGISARQVKAARSELVDLGWIEPEDSDQWTMNRWGRAYRVDLGWSTPATTNGATSSPPTADRGSRSSPPDLQTPNPSGREKDQEPARGPAGASLAEEGGQELLPASTPTSTATTTPTSAPRLDDVRIEDLKDTARLLQLHDQAVAKGLVTTAEADRLRVVGAAEHALAVGKANPAGLFAYLVRGRCWRYLTGEDEDRANARLKAHRRGQPPGSAGPMFTPKIALGFMPKIDPLAGATADPDAPSPADVALVREIRQALIRAGRYSADPFPELARRWGWSRTRYEAALAVVTRAGPGAR